MIKKTTTTTTTTKKQRLIVLFTSDVMKKGMFKRLVYTPPDSSARFTSKLNLSNTKNPD